MGFLDNNPSILSLSLYDVFGVINMGFGKQVGKGLFGLAGGLVRIGTDFVGDVTGSTFVKEVGQAAEKASMRSGELLGQAVDGVAGTAKGLYSGDQQQVDAGLKEAGNAVSGTVAGVAASVKQVYSDGSQVVKGLADGDSQAVRQGARGVARTAAVAILAVGALDVLDVVDIGADGVDADLSPAFAESDVSGSYSAEHLAAVSEDPGTHEVSPHHVSGYVRDDGAVVDAYWRDGDGNTTVDLTEDDGGGYVRSNPDGDHSNNLVV